MKENPDPPNTANVVSHTALSLYSTSMQPF